MSGTVIAYENNAGGIGVFLLEGDTPVWGALYWDSPYPEATAAHDYKLLLQGANPVEGGWEFGDLGGLDEVEREYAWFSRESEAYGGGADVIAEGPDTYPESAGASGRMFLDALGAA